MIQFNSTMCINIQMFIFIVNKKHSFYPMLHEIRMVYNLVLFIFSLLFACQQSTIYELIL